MSTATPTTHCLTADKLLYRRPSAYASPILHVSLLLTRSPCSTIARSPASSTEIDLSASPACTHSQKPATSPSITILFLLMREHLHHFDFLLEHLPQIHHFLCLFNIKRYQQNHDPYILFPSQHCLPPSPSYQPLQNIWTAAFYRHPECLCLTTSSHRIRTPLDTSLCKLRHTQLQALAEAPSLCHTRGSFFLPYLL